VREENNQARDKGDVSSTGYRGERLTGLIRKYSPVSGSRRLLRLTLRNESGQVTVLTAMLATVLLSVMSLVVDTGSAYEGRRDMQNSADAAALAGVMEVAEDRGTAAAESVARQYVQDNLGGTGHETIVTFPDDNKVKVEIDTSRDTFFAGIFGTESMPIRASATADSGLAGQINNLMPLIVPEQRVAAHIGPENEAVFELGEDRPLEALSILYEVNGNQVTYTVTYVNTGRRCVGLEMWSPIPAGAEYVAGSATGGGTFNGTDVRWQWGRVAAGDSRSADFRVSFAGPVNPANQVFASVNGGPVQSADTGGPQLGFFWLADFDAGSNGTPDYADWIINGYPDPVSTGFVANGTGVRASLKSAMDTRIATDPSVVLPLYNYTQGGGHGGEYHVVGFAEFVITGFKFTGNPKNVTGYFTNGTVTPGASGGNPVDHGIMAIWLSE